MTHHSRRSFLRLAGFTGAGIAGAATVGCGDDDNDPAGSPTAASTTSPTVTSTATTTDADPTTEATPTATAAAERAWTALDATGPSARRDHALAASAAGTAYLVGGRSADGPLSDLWSFEATTSTWAPITAEGPEPRFGHNLAFDDANERLLLFGGQRGSTFFSDLWAFDVATGEWTDISPSEAPAARYGAGSAFNPATGDWFVSHGFTSSGRFDDTWTLNATEDAWANRTPSNDLPLERCLLRCAWAAPSESLLLFAGQSNVQPAHDDLWVLDTSAGAWREISSELRPPPRNLYGAYMDDNTDEFVVFAGRNTDGDLGDLWAFSMITETWTELSVPGEAPPARSGHDMVRLPSGGAVLFGGSSGGVDLADTWLLA